MAGSKKCIICGGDAQKTKFGYTKPDKYERWVGLKNIKRLWVRCKDCGFYWQLRNYPLLKLEKIYENGYRDSVFRGETIKEAYDRVQSYRMTGGSENEARYIWFAKNIKFEKAKRVLDVGSGLGVWPQILKDAGFDVTCVDENRDSVDFISELGMQCYYHLSDVIVRDNVLSQFDTVSLVHVLEHIENIDGFLSEIRSRLNGYLFVEVPEASEFDLLSKDHDDFNSCHQWFFEADSLWAILERYGFKPFIHSIRIQHGKTRLLMLCK
jgi:2-polyprenyl-3-methyl-5-hydroxy-6-metoxy-1,4-benzoquinol methylase